MRNTLWFIMCRPTARAHTLPTAWASAVRRAEDFRPASPSSCRCACATCRLNSARTGSACGDHVNREPDALGSMWEATDSIILAQMSGHGMRSLLEKSTTWTLTQSRARGQRTANNHHRGSNNAFERCVPSQLYSVGGASTYGGYRTTIFAKLWSPLAEAA